MKYTEDHRKKAIKVLDDALKKLKQGWCQGCMARDVQGNGVPLNDSRAVAWCLTGAVFAGCFAWENWDREAEKLCWESLHLVVNGSDNPPECAPLAFWNDRLGRSYQQVISVVLEAKRILENKEHPAFNE